MEGKAIAEELGGPSPLGDQPAALKIPELRLHIIGIRGSLMQPQLFSKFDQIMLVGLAGGLNPDLKVGDVIVESIEKTPFRAGKIHTAENIVVRADEKQRLFRETGCDAVDMEGSIVRKAAESAGVPMMHIRAISDSADDAVPEKMMNWVNEVGEPRAGRIAADLALHPGQIPAMIRLGKNSNVALRSLAKAVRQIVETRIDS
jgi:adenosylhomocysteine nucleosidase